MTCADCPEDACQLSLATRSRSTYVFVGGADSEANVRGRREEGSRGDVDVRAVAWVGCAVTRGRKHLASKRLDELIAEAGDRISRIDAASDATTADAFHAGWATYRALGFLEACAIFDLENTEQHLTAFEPLVRAMDGAVIRPPRPAG